MTFSDVTTYCPWELLCMGLLPKTNTDHKKTGNRVSLIQRQFRLFLFMYLLAQNLVVMIWELTLSLQLPHRISFLLFCKPEISLSLITTVHISTMLLLFFHLNSMLHFQLSATWTPPRSNEWIFPQAYRAQENKSLWELLRDKET